MSRSALRSYRPASISPSTSASIRICSTASCHGSQKVSVAALLQQLDKPHDIFAGSDAGGRRPAAMYSLIETAKLNGFDPQLYLTDVLARIADHPARQIADLLHWNWQRADLSERAA